MITAKAFWSWFDENRLKFYAIEEVYDKDLYMEFQAKLKKFHPQLTFQIGGKLHSPIRSLTISACGIIANFARVEELVKQAPAFVNWKVVAFKPADGFGIKVNVGGITFDPKKLKFIPIELVAFPDLSAIRIYMPEYEEEREELFQIGLNALLEACLGEKIAATQINYIDIKSYPESPEEYQMSEDFVLLEDYIEYRKNQIKYN
jgi:hypothetical protein